MSGICTFTFVSVVIQKYNINPTHTVFEKILVLTCFNQKYDHANLSFEFFHLLGTFSAPKEANKALRLDNPLLIETLTSSETRNSS